MYEKPLEIQLNVKIWAEIFHWQKKKRKEREEERKEEKPIKRAVMNGFPCGQLELELGTLRNQPTETSKQAEASVHLLVYVSFLSVLLQAH